MQSQFQVLNDEENDVNFAKLFEVADESLQEIPNDYLNKLEKDSAVNKMIEKQIKTLPPQKRKEIEEEKLKTGKYNHKKLMKYMLEELQTDLQKRKKENPNKKETNKKKKINN